MSTLLNRRALLGRLAALPLAGSELKRQAAQLVGAGAGISGPGQQSGMPCADPIAEGHERPSGRDLVDIIRKSGGIPKWKDHYFQQRAREESRQIDPDIASMVSISLQTAMRMQYERNLKKIRKEFYSSLLMDDDRTSFLKRLKLSWL